jgi:hypothetical protein
MSILELIKTEGAEKVILELTKEIAKKDTYIAQLEKQVAEFKAIQAVLGNVPVAPIVEKKARAKKTAKVSKLNLQTAVKKIAKTIAIGSLRTIVVRNSTAIVTSLKEWLSWPVEMEVTDGCYNLQVFIDTGKYIIDSTKLADNVPQFPDEIPENTIVAFDGKAMANIATCVSKDETRYFLNSVYIDATKDKMVATDGRRLATADIHVEGTGSAIIPVKNPDIMVNSFGCRYGQQYARFEGDNFEYCVRLIDGQYPNWQRVVPQYEEPTIVLKVPTVEQFKVLSDIEKLHKAQGEVNHVRRLVCTPEETSLDFYVCPKKRYEFSCKHSTDIVLCNGTTAVNIDYLKDSHVFGVDKLVGIDGSKSLIGTAGIYTYLIMPMQRD